MEKYRGICAAILAGLCLLSGCFGGRSMAGELGGIDTSAGTVVKSVDTHGGFHGDGETYLELDFNGEAARKLETSVEGNAAWEPLPLSAPLQKAIYGPGGFLPSQSEDIPAIPAIENGYYAFTDRNSKSENPKDATDLFRRHSYNFSIAIYDADEGALYYFTLDT